MQQHNTYTHTHKRQMFHSFSSVVNMCLAVIETEHAFNWINLQWHLVKQPKVLALLNHNCALLNRKIVRHFALRLFCNLHTQRLWKWYLLKIEHINTWINVKARMPLLPFALIIHKIPVCWFGNGLKRRENGGRAREKQKKMRLKLHQIIIIKEMNGEKKCGDEKWISIVK